MKCKAARAAVPSPQTAGVALVSARLFAIALLPLLLLVALPACGGEADEPAPEIVQTTAARDVTDGVAQLSTTVTVRFDRAFTPATTRLPLSSLFEFEVPDLLEEGRTQRVLVRDAAIAPQNARLVTLNVDSLIPEGSTLKVNRSAFREGATGQDSFPVESDLAQGIALLASRAFAPTSPLILESETAPLPVPEEYADPAAARDALAAHLAVRGASDDLAAQVLGAYDEMSPDLVRHPRLRAALAGLIGTFAEPAVENLLTAKNCTGRPVERIAFEGPPGAPDLFAQVTHTASGTRVVSISPIAEGEPLERLMAILAHEAVHCDAEDGRWEEISATAFDTLFYLQLLTFDPSIAEGGSPLARDLNIDAVAMFNSGRRFPEGLGVLPSTSVQQALPGTTAPFGSFAELIANAYEGIRVNDSPVEPLAQLYADRINQDVGMPAGSPFDLTFLDELFGRATTTELVTAAIDTFGLVPVK